ncbi:energy transducer TonB [Flavihumibacter solisilvae]|uniref:TonB C-terminal domain-containing protein n=1 Tax=Flavihumibacter solisilvae TaxID=1349421 RepID=A0A0C1IG60_9BACT|nr:energy transducer TonB [Flavihumibacter solisilvae]KIC93155.1 hypothetical protein OI18_17980 [Flavihumibacter solisilvae]
MAEERKHTNTYSAADIEKYWTGKLTPAEMHAMEKAALDDPFLADAMDGYSGLSGGIQSDLKELQYRLETRTRPGRNLVILNWWKLAGAAIIVVSLGALAYLLLNRQGESRLAMEQANKQEEKSKQVITDSMQGSVHDSLQQILPYTQEPGASAPKELSKAKAQPKIPSKIIHGVVKDNENRPVADASVELQGKIPGIAITDSAGRFRLPAGDSAVNLNVVSEGYAIASRKIEQSEASKEIQIQLSGKVAGVQVDNGTRRSKKASAASAKADEPAAGNVEHATGTESASVAEPANGWEAFRLYLNSNKKVPDSLRSVHGEVELEFNINRLRKVSEIKVIRSLHPALDSQAVKLLENGPRWKPIDGKRTGITVRIGF